MNSVEEAVRQSYGNGSGVFARFRFPPRGRGKARALAAKHPAVLKDPLSGTEWRLSEYEADVRNVITTLITQPIPMPHPHTTPTPDVRVLWNAVPEDLGTLEHVVVCAEYEASSTAGLVEAYQQRGVPAHRIVVVGDLRNMPVEEYTTL